MDKSDEVMEGMSREEMKRLFRIARDQPISAALALDKSGADLLLLDKRKPDTALDRQMRSEAPAATLIDRAGRKLSLTIKGREMGWPRP